MRGWLIYDEEGAKRNAWFISRLTELAARFQISLTLKRCPFDISAEKLPDFALVRTIFPALNRQLEEKGVRCINNAKTAYIANDKWETYRFCKENAIPVLPTWQGVPQEFPCVVKTVDGHGGKEVLWIHSPAEYQTIAAAWTAQGRRFITQKPCAVLGKDMRAYVVGGEIVAAVLRSSQTDFRSNFSLGGSVERVQPTDAQREMVRRIYIQLQADYIGVDFLPDGEKWVVNEIEDSAGARMLYQCTDIDIADVFISYLVGSLKA